ncbi:MAG: hypothetical protein IKJ69_02175 [Clostridia bacterium]|nr:hypothetical protein [Clostridia bacterium]
MIDLSKLWQMRDILPVIVVDNLTGKVINHGYMNKEAFAYTLKTHRVWYYDLEEKTVEMFGKESGEVQKLIQMKADSNYESLLIYVDQVGFVLHKDKGYKTCYIHEIYTRNHGGVSKRRKFGKVEVDENFDYSKEDYEDDYE